MILKLPGKGDDVKTRCTGKGSSWNESSIISNPKITKSGPTHLCFVLLNNDFSINAIWKFDWKYLVNSEQFTLKLVPKISRGSKFRLSKKQHKEHIIFPFKKDVERGSYIKVGNIENCIYSEKDFIN